MQARLLQHSACLQQVVPFAFERMRVTGVRSDQVERYGVLELPAVHGRRRPAVAAPLW